MGQFREISRIVLLQLNGCELDRGMSSKFLERTPAETWDYKYDNDKLTLFAPFFQFTMFKHRFFSGVSFLFGVESKIAVFKQHVRAWHAIQYRDPQPVLHLPGVSE
jgi:hypothetical protein